MSVFSGKVAVVTGAGGIGRGIAELFAAEGGKVVVVDLPSRQEGTPSAAEAAVEAIRAAGGEASACHVAIGEWSAGEKIVQDALAAFGRVDVLISAAGNFAATSLLDLTEAEWDSLNNVHLKGQVSLTQAFARQLVAQGDGGSIVLFSSRAAFFAPTPTYAAAKAGVLGLTTSAALELAPHGINVNAILPSAQTTLFPGDPASRPADPSGLPYVGDLDPAAIAPAVLFLASPAGSDVTGRWIYAAGDDIAFYERPLMLTNRPTLIRGNQRWTIEALGEMLPSLVGSQG